MKVAVIGVGYVGLTTAVCLAELGHEVTAYDVDSVKLGMLARGTPHIFEPALTEMLGATLDTGNMAFCADIGKTVGKAELVFLAVGTPSRRDGNIDLSYMRSAARAMAPFLRPASVVVVKSTVVAGTCDRISDWIRDLRRAEDVHVASNPEFLREGSAIADFMKPDRIVVGTHHPDAEIALRALYRPVMEAGAPLLATTVRNAELIKYAANAFLALKIGFINDVASLCENAGGDASVVAKGIGMDKRIGTAFLAPGPGFGGSCFPKDSRAFVSTGRAFKAPQRLMETLIEQNEARKTDLARRIIREGGLRRGDTIAVLGLAFKAGTDDVRDSAALAMIPLFRDAGLKVRAHDPRAGRAACHMLPDLTVASSSYAAIEGARAIVLLTEWEEYRRLDLRRLARAIGHGTVFDYRNLLDGETVAHLGMHYVGIGSLPISPRMTQRFTRHKGGVAVEQAAGAVWEPLK